MKIKNWYPILFSLALVFSITPQGLAQEKLQLLAPKTADFIPQILHSFAQHPVERLQMEGGVPTPSLSHKPASFSWSIVGQKQKLADRPSVFIKKSKGYWVRAKGKALKAGLPLTISARGALVKITPKLHQSEALLAEPESIDPLLIELVDPQGKSHRQGLGMERRARSQQLKNDGSPFPPGTSAFKIKHELGTGIFTLRSEQKLSIEREYLVYVLEKESDAILALQMGQPAYLYGQSLLVKASLQKAGKNQPASLIQGTLRSPQGKHYPLQLTRQASEEYQARLPLLFQKESIGGLWEVEVAITGQSGQQKVRRMGRTAFNYVIPTAKFLEDINISRTQSPQKELSAQFNLEIAAAGRYEVRAVLYATDSSKQLQPALVSQSANWLEAGYGKLQLVFPLQALEQANLTAPYELRDLTLVDQGQLGILHRQARAVLIKK